MGLSATLKHAGLLTRGTRRNPAEPGGTWRSPAEPGGAGQSPAETGGAQRNAAGNFRTQVSNEQITGIELNAKHSQL
eukprot:10768177-Alexandrium_andersonii.AAC.1